VLLGLAATLVAASLYGVGAVLQALGVRTACASGECTDGAKGMVRLLRHPLTLAGLLLDFVAWVSSRLALHELPLFAVNTALAGSLAVTVALAPRLLDVTLQRSDIAAIGITGIGLTLVGFSAESHTADPPSGVFTVFVLLGLLAVIPVGRWALNHESALAAGAIAGTSFGASALAARAIHDDRTTLALLTDPLLWAMLAYALVGVVLFTRAIERGHVSAVTAAMWSAEIVPASIVGFLVLGDRVRSGWEVAALVGVGLTLYATTRLARTAEATTVAPVDAPVLPVVAAPARPV
jgi:hypothetical protein